MQQVRAQAGSNSAEQLAREIVELPLRVADLGTRARRAAGATGGRRWARRRRLPLDGRGSGGGGGGGPARLGGRAGRYTPRRESAGGSGPHPSRDTPGGCSLGRVMRRGCRRNGNGQARCRPGRSGRALERRRRPVRATRRAPGRRRRRGCGRLGGRGECRALDRRPGGKPGGEGRPVARGRPIGRRRPPRARHRGVTVVIAVAPVAVRIALEDDGRPDRVVRGDRTDRRAGGSLDRERRR